MTTTVFSIGCPLCLWEATALGADARGALGVRLQAHLEVAHQAGRHVSAQHAALLAGRGRPEPLTRRAA